MKRAQPRWARCAVRFGLPSSGIAEFNATPDPRVPLIYLPTTLDVNSSYQPSPKAFVTGEGGAQRMKTLPHTNVP